MTKPESTSWRDEHLSVRHRTWGDATPATDLDWIVIEYDFRVPVALIDYKLGLNYESLHHERFNLAIVATLATGYTGPKHVGPKTDKGLPFFVVSYRHDPWQFKIHPHNEAAREILPKETWNLILEEERYVRFLYWLRGRVAPDEIIQNIRRSA